MISSGRHMIMEMMLKQLLSSILLDEDSEFMDNIISKVSQLKAFKEEVERKRRELETSQTQSLETRLTQMQEQMSLLQANQTGPSGELSSICMVAIITSWRN